MPVIDPVVGHDCDGALALQQPFDLKLVFVLRAGEVAASTDMVDTTNLLNASVNCTAHLPAMTNEQKSSTAVSTDMMDATNF